MNNITDQIDARGLNCPLPVLKAQKRLKSMTPGTSLEILADDPKAPEDFREFAQSSGHELLSLELLPDGMKALIKRKA